MSYQFITQYDSPNYTPKNDCVATWGVSRKLYANEGAKIAIHWWGDPNTNPSFEGVISTLCNPTRGASAHFVATGTGRRVACIVNMADASWATNSANPFTFSIECDPRCRNEDYDVIAELIADIRSEFGDLPLVPHRQYIATACPGNYDLGRLDSIARTKVSGVNYGDTSDSAPIDTTPEWEKKFVKYPSIKVMYAIDNITPLRGFSSLNDIISNYTKGQKFEIAGETTINGNIYYMTKWSVDNNKWNGFDVYELTDKDPNVVPVPPVAPADPSTYDKTQDERISALEAIIKKVIDFLSSIFKNF